MADTILFDAISKRLDSTEKRVDSNERDVDTLRERTHKVINSIGEVEAAGISLDSTMSVVVDNQKRLREDMKEIDHRVTDVEKTVAPAQIIMNNKKVILWTIIISVVIGLSLGNDGRDFYNYVTQQIAKKVIS